MKIAANRQLSKIFYLALRLLEFSESAFVLVVVVVAVAQSCNSQVFFSGIQTLIAVFNWYPSRNCIIIKNRYISSSVTAYPQLACGAANVLHLRHGE